VVDPSQPTEQSDTEILAVPRELAFSIQEIIYLYNHHSEQNIVEALKDLICAVKGGTDNSLLKNQDLVNYPSDLELETEDAFLKSWEDIFNIQVYIDTDIFGELDSRPPALVEVTNRNDETIVQHTEATEIYVQAWKELAQTMSTFPDDLFTRLWTTLEIAKILECSPTGLRRSRRKGMLPIRVKDLILDCISHDGKRSLWFVRPA